MVAPVMGGGALEEGDAPTEVDRDEAEDKDEDSVGDGLEKAFTKKLAIAACIPWWALTSERDLHHAKRFGSQMRYV
jgi:hypothetical protein